MKKMIAFAGLFALCLGLAAPAMAWSTRPPARQVCHKVNVCNTVWYRNWRGVHKRVVCRPQLRCHTVRYYQPPRQRYYHRDYSHNYYGNSLASARVLFR